MLDPPGFDVRRKDKTYVLFGRSIPVISPKEQLRTIMRGPMGKGKGGRNAPPF
jgi:hypothetical protein